MRGPVIFLVTSFAASTIAAPVPISPETPVDHTAALVTRDASASTISPIFDLMKRGLVEKLHTIVERAFPYIDHSIVKDEDNLVPEDEAAKKRVVKRSDVEEATSVVESSLGTRSTISDTRDNRRSSNLPTSNVFDKREKSRPSVVASHAFDKREKSRPSVVASQSSDKREKSRGSVVVSHTFDKRDNI